MAIEVFNSGGSAELQAKTGITPTTASQTITPDSGYDGLSSVQIDAVSLQAKTGITPSTSSQTVTPDSGYSGLSSVQIDAMPSGALSTPSVNSSGLVTASVGTSGYLASGTSATLQLSTQSAKTVTPSTSAQTAVASGKYTTGAVTVSAMSSGALSTPTVSSSGLITASVGTSGYLASGTSATTQLTTQGATTITPTTSSQTAVASGRYTTGAVTVAGDSNLIASNIKSGVSIFGVSGSLATGYKFAEITEVSYGAGAFYFLCDIPSTATIHSIVGSWSLVGTVSSTPINIMAISTQPGASNTFVNFCGYEGWCGVAGGTWSIESDGVLWTRSGFSITTLPEALSYQVCGVYYT